MSIMVLTRFTGFLILYILLSLIFSCGHARQVRKSVVVASGGSGAGTSSMHFEEIYDGVPVAAESDQRTVLGPGGEMMSKGLSRVIKSDEHRSSETYGVQGLKENMNVKRKLSRRDDESMQAKMAGFVSLNADYRVPRPHPPKNN